MGKTDTSRLDANDWLLRCLEDLNVLALKKGTDIKAQGMQIQARISMLNRRIHTMLFSKEGILFDKESGELKAEAVPALERWTSLAIGFFSNDNAKRLADKTGEEILIECTRNQVRILRVFLAEINENILGRKSRRALGMQLAKKFPLDV
jgi:hypothetical protein